MSLAFFMFWFALTVPTLDDDQLAARLRSFDFWHNERVYVVTVLFFFYFLLFFYWNQGTEIEHIQVHSFSMSNPFFALSRWCNQ